jgi:hypothetical protein
MKHHLPWLGWNMWKPIDLINGGNAWERLYNMYIYILLHPSFWLMLLLIKLINNQCWYMLVNNG